MLVLGIETSCDETGAALYDTQRGLLGHTLHSQVNMHREYGGVVPELASRDHIRRVLPLTRQLFRESNVSLEAVDAIAYTQGPGLAGALLTGAGFSSALAFGHNLPVLNIHHLEGHLLSPFLSDPAPDFPFIALLVSGGHTQLMQVNGIGQYRLLGETVDDAAGEAFDKTAKLLGLNYPGGKLLAELAAQGQAGRFRLPRPMLNSHDLNFSFSGLKTAAALLINRHEANNQIRADIAFAFEDAITDVLVRKSLTALSATGLKQLVVAGGVGANSRLRQKLLHHLTKISVTVFFPELEFCTDNGAMIALAGALRLQQLNKLPGTNGSFTVKARWNLEDLPQ
ncbi:tRNA (adenosine(37)-N6)-threonylcarbamoyltransferase complex transferase subunit TsaD [Nitrosomonas sp.]|uniref:tRNA (adenosine(37)-N6)-threonylcarbamoyltransferase complex transferase subunit TsaD n=1 Tax=Nitrosomonas sp. TaxID=42353 RepID=UPI0025FE1CC0|nr:tRNA (adenosine(37)-N6)-threonylcarbamoyltransferase complex transferase subunit TsaD [Nitrosomonas sp.]MCC6915969.1 tRNA (adenosine(37)-N6)-threonylcarbamoyltransferase complex transferase subunit TsaD [Nitrosomonas sp.]